MSAIEIETETESTKSPLTLTFRGFEGRSTREHVRGERASVMLNPKTRTLSVFKSVGSGVPELVWNFEARMFALPECASLDDIQEVLEACSESICELFDLYEGREWTGGKYEGKWENVDRVREIMESLTEACADEHSVKRYWAPSELFAPARAEMLALIHAALAQRGDRDLSMAISDTLDREELGGEGVIVDEDEAADLLLEWAQEDEGIKSLLAGRKLDARDDLTWHVMPESAGTSLRVEVASDAGEAVYRRVTDLSLDAAKVGYRTYERAGSIEVFEPWNGVVLESEGDEPTWEVLQ